MDGSYSQRRNSDPLHSNGQRLSSVGIGFEGGDIFCDQHCNKNNVNDGFNNDEQNDAKCSNTPFNTRITLNNEENEATEEQEDPSVFVVNNSELKRPKRQNLIQKCFKCLRSPHRHATSSSLTFNDIHATKKDIEKILCDANENLFLSSSTASESGAIIYPASSDNSVIISGHSEIDTLYASNDEKRKAQRVTINCVNAPNSSTVQCGCENINCPFCNLMLNIERTDPQLTLM